MNTEDSPYTLVAPDYAALIGSTSATPDGPMIRRIFQADGVRLIRIAFAAGQVMREHSTNAPLIVQVLAGAIEFRVAGDAINLPAGAVLHVRPHEVHELEAVDDSQVLLILHPRQHGENALKRS